MSSSDTADAALLPPGWDGAMRQAVEGLAARVTLGDPYYTSGQLQHERRPPERKRGLPYDSVIANASSTQVHRELIVYDHRQAFPEYVVRYKEG